MVSGTGEPEAVLQLRDVEEPELKPGYIGIEPHAVGLNYLDAMACRGSYPWNPEPPFIPCAELVGEVYAVNGVSGIKVGQRVVAMIPSAHGALSQRCAAPAQFVFPLEPGIRDEAAAALLVTYQTAWFALERSKLQAGETVLIQGGAGGVGTAAIQLCKLNGARVIATASRDAKLEICRQQGADHAVCHSAPDFVDQVMEITRGKGVNVVLDQVGGTAFDHLVQSIAIEGRLVLIGWASGTPPNIMAEELVKRNASVIGLSWGSTYPVKQPDRVKLAHQFIQQQVIAGNLNPLICHTAAFEHAAGLMQMLASGSTTGKAVVRLRGTWPSSPSADE